MTGLFEVPLHDLTPDECLLLARQAEALRDRFADRVAVAATFDSISWLARHVAAEGTEGFVPMGVLRDDETAPVSHRIDDQGTTLAFAMQCVEDPDSPPAVRHAWGRIVEALAFQIRLRAGTLMR